MRRLLTAFTLLLAACPNPSVEMTPAEQCQAVVTAACMKVFRCDGGAPLDPCTWEVKEELCDKPDVLGPAFDIDGCAAALEAATCDDAWRGGPMPAACYP